MNIYHLFFWMAVGFIAIVCLIYYIEYVEKEGAVTPPKHIPSWEVDKHTAQEVYDWIVYVTRMTGHNYLDQMIWNRHSRHDFLLSDLRTVLHARTQEEMIERMREIGTSYGLDTGIVDEPF